MKDALEQLNAVLTAPIPFFFALALAVIAIWRAFEWAYRAKYEKTNELFELARSEASLIADAAKRKEAELTETLNQMRDQIGNLVRIERIEKDKVPSEIRVLLDNLNSTSTIANNQLIELGGNLKAASEAFKSAPGMQPSGPLTTRSTKS